MSGNIASKELVLDTKDSSRNFVDCFQYGNELPRYGIVYSLDKNGNPVMHEDHNEISDCREIAIGNLRGCIGEKKRAEGIKFTGADKLRYIIGFSTGNKVSAEGCAGIGVKIARAYDHILKCKPTTSQRITHLSYSSGQKKVPIGRMILYYIEADKPWVKSPDLASLHMLLIRLGRFKSVADLKSIPVSKIPEALPKSVSASSVDGDRVKTYHKAWIQILKEYDKMFARKKFSTTYDLDNGDPLDNYMWEDGIDALCEKETD
jgi:hypothetical protein